MESILGMSMIFTLIALFVAVLWILLPFAVFGTKPMIEKAIAEAKEANVQLKLLAEQNRELLELHKSEAISRSRNVRPS